MSDNDLEFYANFILENKITIREASSRLNIPKSTLHYKVTKNLKEANPILYKTLHEYLKNNFEEKHIRGGEATRRKWQERKYHKK